MNEITNSETIQVITDLFTYVQNIVLEDFPNIKWYIEYFADKEEALCLRREGNIEVMNWFITGERTAILPFRIQYQCSCQKATYCISDAIDEIALVFDHEKENGFPNLVLTDAEPIDLVMKVAGRNEENQQEMITFSAIFQLIYKKKGWYE